MRAWISLTRSMRRTLPVGFLRELVGAVGGADGDGEGVHPGFFHEVGGLIGVGQQHGVVQFAFRAMTILFPGPAGFQRPQAAQLAFHGDAARVGNVGHLLGGLHIVFIAGRRLHVLPQGSIHHHRAEARLDGACTHRRRGAVILVHADGYVRPHFRGRENEVAQEGFTGIAARAGGALQDDRSVDRGSGLHDRLDLLHVVDVESRQAVMVFCRVIEQLSEGNDSHGFPRMKNGGGVKQMHAGACLPDPGGAGLHAGGRVSREHFGPWPAQGSAAWWKRRYGVPGGLKPAREEP